MKKNLLNVARTGLAVATLALVASTASAWTPPSDTFPAGNVDAPVNTGTVAQTKKSDLNIVGTLTTTQNGLFGNLMTAVKGRVGCSFAALNCPGVLSTDLFTVGAVAGGLVKGIAVNSDGSFLAGALNGFSGNSSTAKISQGIVAKSDGSVSIGKIASGNSLFPTQGLFVGNVLNQAASIFFGKLSITLSGTDSVGRNALDINVSNDNKVGGAGAVFQTNADRFSFYDNVIGKLVAISAQKIQLTEGAGAGKVLVSDASGNASWGEAAATGTVDMIEVHTSFSSGAKRTASCPSTHPIAVSAGGGCSIGMLSKVNVSYLGNGSGGLGNASVECRKDPLKEFNPDGTVNGVDLICAKAVPGGIYGGMAAASSSGGGQQQNLAWYDVPTSTPNGSNGQTCQAWLDANGVNYYGGALSNIGFKGSIVGLGTTQSYDASGNSISPADTRGACMYARTINGQAYCTDGAANAKRTLAIAGTSYDLAPVAKCPSGSVTPIAIGNASSEVGISGVTQTKY